MGPRLGRGISSRSNERCAGSAARRVAIYIRKKRGGLDVKHDSVCTPAPSTIGRAHHLEEAIETSLSTVYILMNFIDFPLASLPYRIATESVCEDVDSP